ncbi:MAG: MarR family transcriptional regulator [Chloroflexi bacterium]|nr:MarR family transcriptional regulator [Chloroflexota bacterium]
MSEAARRQVEELIDRLSQVMRLIFHGVKVSEMNLEPGSARLRVLINLNRLGSPRIGELASALGIAVPSLTAMLERMENEGMIVRHIDPDDRRAVRLHLSASGRRRLNAFYAERRKKWSDRIARLTPPERKRLIEIFDELRQLLTKAREES